MDSAQTSGWAVLLPRLLNVRFRPYNRVALCKCYASTCMSACMLYTCQKTHAAFLLSMAVTFAPVTLCVYADAPLRKHTGALRGACAHDVLCVTMYGDGSDIDTDNESSKFGSESNAEMQQPALGILLDRIAEVDREAVMHAALQAADNDGAQPSSLMLVAGGEPDCDHVQLAAGTNADGSAPPAQHDVQRNTYEHRAAVGQRNERTARLDDLAEGSAGERAGNGARQALAICAGVNDAVPAAQNSTQRNAIARQAGVSQQRALHVQAAGSAQPRRFADGVADALVPGVHARSSMPPAQHDARHAADNARAATVVSHGVLAADDAGSEAQHVPAPGTDADSAAPPFDHDAPHNAGDDHVADGVDDNGGVPNSFGGEQLELAPGGHADNATHAAAHIPQQHAPAGIEDAGAHEGARLQGFIAEGNAAHEGAAGRAAVAPTQQGVSAWLCCVNAAIDQKLTQFCAAC